MFQKQLCCREGKGGEPDAGMFSLIMLIPRHYKTKQDLQVNDFRRDTPPSDGDRMAAAIFATKKGNTVIITSCRGQYRSEHTHSAGGNDVTAYTLYRHLAEQTEEQRVS